LSKRKLIRLVKDGYVDGWDDPRMPTLSGMRRRGIRPQAVRKFCDRIGAAKTNSVIDIALLEHTIREDLDPICKRVMAVLDPIKIVIENFPEDKRVEFDVDYFRHDPEKSSTRKVVLTREVYIEREDFMIDPPPKYYRLHTGKEVRLMNACLVTCTDYEQDEDGNVTLVRCTYDPESLGGQAPDGRKVKGTLHWVSAAEAVEAEIRQYDYLIHEEGFEEETEDFIDRINRDSKTVSTAMLEPAMAGAKLGDRYQFMRQGFYFVDPIDSAEGKLAFNKIVSLRDSWSKKHRKN
jgi:glutaminyl-tRNA synthetase